MQHHMLKIIDLLFDKYKYIITVNYLCVSSKIFSNWDWHCFLKNMNANRVDFLLTINIYSLAPKQISKMDNWLMKLKFEFILS